ncbi:MULTISPECIES: hypothetical protein [unclassified Streptomyces]|uniref:hypothetical protein n=1 Tax=unclassified Streptomyces TaxID=2593676 RepID=UPI00081DC3CF|nr:MULTISPECIES: hypothetical protein [unclassified Streptomyces]SCF72187.1 hypothetical protein GA0115259_1015316 [Streptomyces sp. MnatMP-M17]
MSLRYFNQTGWTAIFNGTETGRMVRVEGWDQATGTALVVDPKRGALRLVTDYEDFSHLERADQVVAAVPGGGWRPTGRTRDRVGLLLLSRSWPG